MTPDQCLHGGVLVVVFSHLCGDRRHGLYPQVERGAFGTIERPQHISWAAGESLSTWISVPHAPHVYTSPCLAGILATSHLVNLGHGFVAAVYSAGPGLEDPHHGPAFLAHEDGEFGVGHPITPVSIILNPSVCTRLVGSVSGHRILWLSQVS